MGPALAVLSSPCCLCRHTLESSRSLPSTAIDGALTRVPCSGLHLPCVQGLIIARKQVAHVNNEKNILAKCSHPFLVNLVGWYQDRHELYMLFELLLGGELFSIMSKVSSYSSRLVHAPHPAAAA